MTTVTPFTTEELVGLAPVIPVVVIDDLEDAVPLATALVRGGLPAIEVTLRTPPALAAIERIAAEVEGAVVGAGTVTTAQQVDDALAAGARFLVSPGATPNLLDALQASGVPFLAGHGDGVGHRRAARARDHLREVLPGRDHRRHQGAEGVRRPVPADALLPDGRDRPRQGAGLPGAAERGVRRRLVDDQG